MVESRECSVLVLKLMVHEWRRLFAYCLKSHNLTSSKVISECMAEYSAKRDGLTKRGSSGQQELADLAALPNSRILDLLIQMKCDMESQRESTAAAKAKKDVYTTRCV